MWKWLVYIFAICALCNGILASIQLVSLVHFTKADFISKDSLEIRYTPFSDIQVQCTSPTRYPPDATSVLVKPSMLYPYHPEQVVMYNPVMTKLNTLCAGWFALMVWVALQQDY